MSAMSRSLRPSGIAILLIADSVISRHAIFADDLARELAPRANLQVVAIGSQARPHFHQPTARAFSRRPRREHAIVLRPREAVIREVATPTIHFEANLFGSECDTDVPDGGPLVDVCDAVLAPVPFSCRSASCATCLIEVVEGLDCFEAPADAEAELLAILGEPPERRLACSAELRPGPGLVRIRVAGDEI